LKALTHIWSKRLVSCFPLKTKNPSFVMRTIPTTIVKMSIKRQGASNYLNYVCCFCFLGISSFLSATFNNLLLIISKLELDFLSQMRIYPFLTLYSLILNSYLKHSFWTYYFWNWSKFPYSGVTNSGYTRHLQ